MSSGIWHDVRQGEWLTKIGYRYKITDWRKRIWEHPENAGLAARRDPNLLFPGDRIFVPEPDPHFVSCTTDQVHKFAINSELDEFHLKVLDAAGRPLVGEYYILQLGKHRYTGVSSDQGQIDIAKVDPTVEDGSLEFPSKSMTIKVRIGQMNPGQGRQSGDTMQYDDGVSGLQMRLTNLGYLAGEADGVIGPRTRGAIIEFQVFEMRRKPMEATGRLDEDTRQAIIEKHGS